MWPTIFRRNRSTRLLDPIRCCWEAQNTLVTDAGIYSNIGDVDVVPPGNSLVTNGPFGTITDDSLDGSYAAWGWVDAATVPTSSKGILRIVRDNDKWAAFSYPLGAGSVYFSIAELGYQYSGSPNQQTANLYTVYSPNVLFYAASLLPESKYDWYSINVTAGQRLQVTTRTPGDGSGEPDNAVNPRIELFDPAGNFAAPGIPLPDGRNEVINYTATVSGEYRIRISTEGTFPGEYILAAIPIVKGDWNQDGQRTADDLTAMLTVLTDLPAFQAKNGLSPADLLTIADINVDGQVNNRDIQAMIDLLILDQSGGSGSIAVGAVAAAASAPSMFVQGRSTSNAVLGDAAMAHATAFRGIGGPAHEVSVGAATDIPLFADPILTEFHSAAPLMGPWKQAITANALREVPVVTTTMPRDPFEAHRQLPWRFTNAPDPREKLSAHEEINDRIDNYFAALDMSCGAQLGLARFCDGGNSKIIVSRIGRRLSNDDPF